MPLVPWPHQTRQTWKEPAKCFCAKERLHWAICSPLGSSGVSSSAGRRSNGCSRHRGPSGRLLHPFPSCSQAACSRWPRCVGLGPPHGLGRTVWCEPGTQWAIQATTSPVTPGIPRRNWGWGARRGGGNAYHAESKQEAQACWLLANLMDSEHKALVIFFLSLSVLFLSKIPVHCDFFHINLSFRNSSRMSKVLTCSHGSQSPIWLMKNVSLKGLQ